MAISSRRLDGRMIIRLAIPTDHPNAFISNCLPAHCHPVCPDHVSPLPGFCRILSTYSSTQHGCILPAAPVSGSFSFCAYPGECKNMTIRTNHSRTILITQKETRGTGINQLFKIVKCKHDDKGALTFCLHNSASTTIYCIRIGV